MKNSETLRIIEAAALPLLAGSTLVARRNVVDLLSWLFLSEVANLGWLESGIKSS